MLSIPQHIATALLDDLQAARRTLTPEAVEKLPAVRAAGALLPPKLGGLPVEIRETADYFAQYLAAFGAAHPGQPNTVALVMRRQLREQHEAEEANRPAGSVDPRRVRLERVSAPELYRDARVSTFRTEAKTDPERNQLEAMKRWATAYVRHWKRPGAGGTDERTPVVALITGPSGCGKTHLAWAIGSAIATEHDGYPVVVSAGDLVDDIRDAYGRDRGEAGVVARLDRYRRADFLAIDDLSRHCVRGDPSGIVYDVLNHRERETRPTLITSNESIEVLEQWLGVAVMERVLQWGAVHELAVESYRVRRLTQGGGR